MASKALRKKTNNSPNLDRRRTSDGMLHPMAHERLQASLPELTKCDTVDLGDIPGSRKSRSRSPSPNIQTIPEDGEMPPKRVPRFRKASNFDIPRSRSPSPCPAEYAEQAAVLKAQLQNNNSPKPSPEVTKKLAPSLSVTSPDGSTESTSDKENEVEEEDDATKLALKTKKSADKLRHVIDELIETERKYGKDLVILMTTYLMPLKRAAFFPDEEVDALIHNIKEITEFQTVFQKSIEEAQRLVAEYDSLEDPNDFRRIVFSIGSAFLFHQETFNLYSTFCAVHSKAQKLLKTPSGKAGKQLQEFLQSRPAPGGCSGTLGISSYLIKPMQRILKYPLLLREMQGRFDPESETYYHLGGSLKEMQRVANHINDMMKVHEEYGNIFESLLAANQQPKDKKGTERRTELDMDDLVMYEKAFWSNPADFLGKDKRAGSSEPEMTVLVFKTAVVLICKEAARRTKRRSIVDLMSAAPKGTTLGEDGDGTSFKMLIPIANLQVKISEDEDSEDYFPWEIIHKESTESTDLQDNKRVFRFYCNTAELKNNFVKTIKQTINNFNRKRILQDAGKAAHVVRKINEFKSGGKRLEDLKSKPVRTLRRWQSSAEDSKHKLKKAEGVNPAPTPKRTETI
ncbi:rho guanine nucleotide exchange factor TIAM1-like [Amphiura filiformis]|uniref:rho guanine nucleotide exchange factor TIAM1-like n=1 Tax=Amphiura filiformis TaxID=82378 RepID=UPI003B21F5DD